MCTSAQSGPVICGKPVIRAAVPALCTVHFQKAQRHVSQALKKAGFSGSSSNKPAPKFHVIIAEYVCQIQAKEKHRKQLLRMLWLRKNMSVKLSTYDPQMMQEHDMDVESTQILHMKKQICFNAVELFLVCGRISNCILLELLVDSTSDDIERSLCSDSAERNLHVIRVRTCQLSYDWPDMAGKCHGYGSEMDFTYKNEVIDTVQHQYVTCFEVFSYHSS